MGFMELDIEGPCIWLRVEDASGSSAILPGDLLGVGLLDRVERKMTRARNGRGGLLAKPLDSITLTIRDVSALQPYQPESMGPIVSAEAVSGVAWRLSAPGYLDCTDWTLADRPDEDRAFREACDAHEDICINCGRTDANNDERLSDVCADCVSPDASFVDTAGCTSGSHDISNGQAWRVRFESDMGDVIVSDRYVGTDEDGAIDLACGVMVERRPEMFLERLNGSTVPEDSPITDEEHETMMDYARSMVDSCEQLATRYAAGA